MKYGFIKVAAASPALAWGTPPITWKAQRRALTRLSTWEQIFWCCRSCT